MGVAHKAAYRRWLQNSFQWETVRLIALAKVESRCRICGYASQSNHVHHLWYRQKWDDTQDWDVVVLCDRCHKRVHELMKPPRLKVRRATKAMRVLFWKTELEIKREVGILKPRVHHAPNPPRQRDLSLCSLCETDQRTDVVSIGPDDRKRNCGLCADCLNVYQKLPNPEALGSLFRYARQKKKQGQLAKTP